jgi:hypothetical protein
MRIVSFLVLKRQSFIDAHEKRDERPKIRISLLARLHCRSWHVSVDKQIAGPVIRFFVFHSRMFARSSGSRKAGLLDNRSISAALRSWMPFGTIAAYE